MHAATAVYAFAQILRRLGCLEGVQAHRVIVHLVVGGSAGRGIQHVRGTTFLARCIRSAKFRVKVGRLLPTCAKLPGADAKSSLDAATAARFGYDLWQAGHAEDKEAAGHFSAGPEQQGADIVHLVFGLGEIDGCLQTDDSGDAGPGSESTV